MPDTPFLDRLPDADKQHVLSLLTEHSYARGEILIGQEEEAYETRNRNIQFES